MKWKLWYDFHSGNNHTLVFIYSVLSFVSIVFNSISQTGFSRLTWNYLPYCYFSTLCMLFLKTVSKLFLSVNFCLQSIEGGKDEAVDDEDESVTDEEGIVDNRDAINNNISISWLIIKGTCSDDTSFLFQISFNFSSFFITTCLT